MDDSNVIHTSGIHRCIRYKRCDGCLPYTMVKTVETGNCIRYNSHKYIFSERMGIYYGE